MSLDLNSAVPTDVYEYAHIWAEESGATTAGSAEWSFGNGATGYMGLRWDNTGDWEIVGMSFMADTYAALAQIQVDVMNYANAPSNAAANTLASIALADAQDGGGTTDNASKWVDITPVLVPAGAVLGFITRGRTGNSSDARVLVRLRRKVGTFLTLSS